MRIGHPFGIMITGCILIAAEFKNNLTRTALELLMACANATNSVHSNSADEPFTTPGEEYVRLAAQAQSILLEESGLFRHTMNTVPGGPGMKAVERAVEAAILEEFREMDRLGGVLQAVEQRYQRSQIQSAAHRLETQIYDGTRPIIGLNRYVNEADEVDLPMARTAKEKQRQQADRVRDFKHRHAAESGPALDRLARVAEAGGNTFEALLEAVEVCSLGQITERLHEVVGHFRPVV